MVSFFWFYTYNNLLTPAVNDFLDNIFSAEVAVDLDGLLAYIPLATLRMAIFGLSSRRMELHLLEYA